MQIDSIRIDTLIPYVKNSRTHGENQIAQIAASIREFGFTNPLLIDGDGGIIAGHGRLMAARKLGMSEVPCIRLLHLTETQRRAYVIADNKLALNAGWDEEMLALELGELNYEGFDVSLLGFTDSEIKALGVEDAIDENEDVCDYQKGILAGRFMIPPFSVLNAREGWWQDRKRAWLALGISSELGRGGASDNTHSHPPPVTKNADGTLNFNGSAGQSSRFDRQRHAAAPGGSARPACDYSRKQRGDGTGRPING